MFAQRIRRNIGWKTLAVLVDKFLRLLLMFFVARALAPATYGQYTYAVAMALLCVQVTDLGLGLFLTREIARDVMPTSHLVGHVFTLKAALGLAYLVLMAVLAWLHRDEGVVAWALVLAGLSSLVTTTIEAIHQVFRGVQRLELEARSSSVLALIQFATVTGGLVWLRHLDPKISDTESAMLLVASTVLIANAAGLAYTARLLARVARPRFGWSRQMLGRFRREVLPLGIAIVASLIYFKIDVLMLRHMKGDVETGVYTLAYKLFENMAMVPAVLMAATFPAISQALEKDPQAAVRLYQTTRRILLVASGVIATGLLAFPFLGPLPDLIPYFLGKGYAPAVPVLMSLAPAVILTFINYLETHMLVALGLVRAQMAVTIGLIGVNYVLNLALIPRWGGVGAALATALTEVGLLAVCLPLVARGLRRRLADVEPAEGPARAA